MISLSTLAWITVIIAQALIHIFIFGRRKNEEEVALAKSQAEIGDVAADLPSIEDPFQPNLSARRAYSTNEMDSNEGDDPDGQSIDDPNDECDSYDEDGEREMESLNDLLERTAGLDTAASCTVRNRRRRTMPLDHREEPLGKGEDNPQGDDQAVSGDDASSGVEYSKSEAMRSSSSSETNNDLHEENDDFDSIDEDEQWRYELVKEYYSTSANPSILTIASRSMSEPDDPALETVQSIDDLKRKFLKSAASLDDHSMRYQTSTSPVQIMSTISCA